MKIAVISGWAHYELGGVENYSAICYESWGLKHEVVEYPLLNGLGNVKVREPNFNVKIDYALLGLKPHSIQWAKSYPKKTMKKIYQEFDLVIINNLLPPRKWLKHPKSVLVQHMHLKWYSLLGKNWKTSLAQFFTSILFGVGTFTNSFYKASNVVFFDQLSKAPTITNKFHYIPIPAKNHHEIQFNYNQRENFVFIGRLENQQKNLKQLIKLANLNDDVFIYGFGSDQKMFNKGLNNLDRFKGGLKKSEVDRVLKNAKALIITSNFEGFPTIAVEALTNGTPVILFDSFETAPFFAKSQAGFLIPKGNLKLFHEKIQWLRDLPPEEYQTISDQAVLFAKNYLTKEIFWKNWDNLINNFK